METSKPLSKDLLKRIKKFKKALQEVELSKLEITLENFRQDPNRDKEIVWWEKLTEKYLKKTKDKLLTTEKKKEIFKEMFLKAYDKGK
jgi:hypothetical protein